MIAYQAAPRKRAREQREGYGRALRARTAKAALSSPLSSCSTAAHEVPSRTCKRKPTFVTFTSTSGAHWPWNVQADHVGQLVAHRRNISEEGQ